ncbi:SDR family oxidoreductase [Scopulibacillus darangshiensis]|nr:SDR family oxidoreductase [Scopulibacillus darangshiensis]
MRHVLITGGSKGIGKMVAKAFLDKSYSVTINYRSDDQAAHRLNQELGPYAEHIQLLQGDITKRDDIDRIVSQTLERFNRVDCLINNAGPFVFERKKLVDHTESEWKEMIEGNLSSVFHLVKQIVPVMRKQRFGRIITYGFQNADSAPGWLDHGAFAAGKVGLVSLTKTLAIEEAGHGITANMVCPGIILPDMKEATIEEAKRSGQQRTPMGRSETGEDIARSILFLCQEQSDMISGTVMDMTGTLEVINRFRPSFDE